MYSRVSFRQVGWNKHVRKKIFENQTSMSVGIIMLVGKAFPISISILVGINVLVKKITRASVTFHTTCKIETYNNNFAQCSNFEMLFFAKRGGNLEI